jgi:hypothetical protein
LTIYRMQFHAEREELIAYFEFADVEVHDEQLAS